MLIVIDNGFTIALGARPAELDLGSWFHHAVKLASWSLTGGQLSIITLTAGLFAMLVTILNRTSIGKLIKAYSGNPEFVKIIGRKPHVILMIVYSVGSLFAAVAGIYVATDTGMKPGLGSTYFIISIMAVFLGGIGSMSGAFISAMTLGLLQNVLLLSVDAEWTLPLIFVVFLILITVSPQGLVALKFDSWRGAS